MAIVKLGDSLFFPGIESVQHEVPASPLGPVQTDVTPAQVPTRDLLDELFALDDFHSCILRSLEPQLFDPAMLRPADWSATLTALPRRLQEAAQAWPKTARACGQAAQMLAEEMARRGQAWQSVMALRQV
jgi:hypothetical protein